VTFVLVHEWINSRPASNRIHRDRNKATLPDARDYSGVRIDLDPLPVMEKRKRFAIGKDRVDALLEKEYFKN